MTDTERRAMWLRKRVGAFSVLFLSFGTSVMLWERSERVVPLITCAVGYAVGFGVLIYRGGLTYRAKRGRLWLVVNGCLLLIIMAVPTLHVLRMPNEAAWWVHAAALSILAGGVLAGTVLGAQLTLRRLRRAARTDREP